MKIILLIASISAVINYHHKHRQDDTQQQKTEDNKKPSLKMSPYQEQKVHLYAQINTRPELKQMIGHEGLTYNYTQMLTSPDNYVILNNTPSASLNISHQVVVGKQNSNKNLGYSYGELESQQHIDQNKVNTAFTHNYKEMLANPDRKMLVLGIQPEMNTENTRVLKAEMEDPIIRPDEQEQQQQKLDYEKRLEQKTQEIREYLDTVHDELTKNAGKNIDDEQIKIIQNLKDYIQKGEGGSDEVKQFSNSINQILEIFKDTKSQRLKSTSVLSAAIKQKGVIEGQIDQNYNSENQRKMQQLKNDQDQIRVKKVTNKEMLNQESDIKNENENKQQQQSNTDDKKEKVDDIKKEKVVDDKKDKTEDTKKQSDSKEDNSNNQSSQKNEPNSNEQQKQPESRESALAKLLREEQSLESQLKKTKRLLFQKVQDYKKYQDEKRMKKKKHKKIRRRK